MGDRVAVELQGIVKHFGRTQALKGVDFCLREGEVHALVGANGSGKSTLMKVIYGAHRPTGGTMRLYGTPVHLRSPGQALRVGIAAVPQELPLVPSLSVAENIFFGSIPRRLGVVRWRAMRRGAAEVLARMDEAIDPLAPIGSLDLARQQLVSVARALARGASTLVFDEPTSSLGPDSTARLLGVIANLRSQGRAVAFISQRLDDIFAIADRVTVIRDGSVVHSGTREEMTADLVTRLMVGDDGAGEARRRDPGAGPAALRVEDLGAGGHYRGVSFSLHDGEVLGLVGLAGSGAEELVRSLYGLTGTSSGRVWLGERDVTSWPSRRRARAGMAYISGDRQHEGLVRGQTVAFNLTLALNRRASLALVPDRRQADMVQDVIRRLGLRPPDPGALVDSLSGGNQQRVLIGRWLLA
ncbi:MAG: sugar ABC transporter ATP-binding protein, partial [Acidimicrobiales bacterium]